MRATSTAIWSVSLTSHSLPRNMSGAPLTLTAYSTAERPLNPHTHSYTEASHSPSPSSSTSLCSSPSLASSTSPTPFPSLASSPVIPSEPYYSTNATSPSIPDSPSFTSYSIPTTPVESDPVHEYRPRVQPLAVTFGPTQLRSAIRMAKEARRMQYEMERRERFNSVAYEGDEEGEGKRSEWRRLSTVEESECELLRRQW